MSADRRRSPRIEILGRLHGHIASLDVPVTVREISLGGLSLETSFAFPTGIVHEFRLTLGDGSAVELRGRIVYSRDGTSPEGEHIFVSGVQFVDDEPAAGDSSVDHIIEKIK
jgi:PilZ domain